MKHIDYFELAKRACRINEKRARNEQILCDNCSGSIELTMSKNLCRQCDYWEREYKDIKVVKDDK